MSTQSAITIDNLSKDFSSRSGTVHALHNVSLNVAPGEFIAFIGPSGCGKSTLLRMMADLDEPSSGVVTIFGKTARRARLDQDYGIAFQQAGLLPWRTVRANIELPLQLRKQKEEQRRSRSDALLALIGLEDFADQRPDQLSGGMQQRVAIARALACEPSLILMDEPFGALDEMTRERMQVELLRIAAETRAAVVFVTHSIPEAVFLADRVVVMSPRPGKITDVIAIPREQFGPEGDDGSATRESPAFYNSITAVREALHQRHTVQAEGHVA